MLIILSLIVFLNTGHSVSDAWGQALKVSGTVSSPPYLFMNNEKPDGFFVDFINEIADVTTLEIDVDLRVWSDVLASIKRGDIDIVLDIYYSE